MQWTEHYGEARWGEISGGGCNRQGVMVRRDMEVTQVVEEDAVDRVSL